MRCLLPPLAISDPSAYLRYVPGSNSNAERRQVHSVAPLTIHEDKAYVLIELDVPGFTIEDLEIIVRNSELLITGVRDLKIPSDANVLLNNRDNISVERSVRLDDSLDPDSVNAVLEFGVLKIELGRKPEAQPKTIRIRSSN
jgi:HSP20 family protein